MADRRHGTVQTSAVLLLKSSKSTSAPPPSPPSPSASPPESLICEPIEPLTLDDQDVVKERRLRQGTHVLNTEALALRNLTSLYENDDFVRDCFDRAVQAITRRRSQGGKLIIIGVGKSGHIGKKLVATFQSLGIPAVFLHPTEALHGDMGLVSASDTLLFITFSGKTPELLGLLPHLDENLDTIVLTSHVRPTTCELIRQRPRSILLPAPIHEPEPVSFGVAAPTTSTTAALAVGDALALTAAEELHQSLSSVFARNHPGGAIGAVLKKGATQDLKVLATSWEDIPVLQSNSDNKVLGVDLLKAGFGSAMGWYRVGDRVAAPSKVRSLDTAELTHFAEDIPGLLVAKEQMLCLPLDATIEETRALLPDHKVTPEGSPAVSSAALIALVEGIKIVAILEPNALYD